MDLKIKSSVKIKIAFTTFYIGITTLTFLAAGNQYHECATVVKGLMNNKWDSADLVVFFLRL